MPRILTGNRLETGDVLYWNGSDWSLSIRDAVAIGDEGEELVARLTAEERINDPVLIEAEPSSQGWRPRTTRERVRAFGPSVRADLGRPDISVESI